MVRQRDCGAVAGYVDDGGGGGSVSVGGGGAGIW
jgi:hypothetical protein